MTDINSICDSIDKANYYYYEMGHSVISDNEFENLLDKLRILDPTNPRLVNVGVEPTLSKVKHDYPMGSLDNIDINKPEELKSYIKRNSSVGNVLYHVTPKIDGSSIAVYYKNGELDKVLTRGNGIVGQDITAKASLFKNIPQRLNQDVDIIIRGEAVMLRDDFKKYIEITKTEGVKNPRNVGNGLIVRKDLMGAGLIHFYPFGCFSNDREILSVHSSYSFMEDLGLVVIGCILANEGGLETAINTIYSDDYPFDIDGAVVKVDNMEHRAILNLDGDDLRPRSDKAIKYNSKRSKTTITGVNFTVGSTGRITPTLMVDPVEIGGVVVSNVLVYNFDEINRLNIGIGDEVVVVLAGDVIPKLVQVVDKKSECRILPPTTCPVCGTLTAKKELKKGFSVDLYCINKNCDAIKFEKIKSFIGSSKRGMGILGIGDNLINKLIDSGLVKSFSDLYKLTITNIQNITLGNGILGEKRALMILENIKKSKDNSISKIIGSLGIEGFAASRIELIIKFADIDLNSILDWTDENKLDYISKMKHHYLPSDTMVNGVKELRELKNELLELHNIGFCVNNPHDEEMIIECDRDWSCPTISGKDSMQLKSDHVFRDKRFCFTGTRQFLGDVEKVGGVIKSGISKDLDYLVQKDLDSTSSKSTKAKSLGIKIVSIDQIKYSLDNNTEL